MYNKSEEKHATSPLVAGSLNSGKAAASTGVGAARERSGTPGSARRRSTILGSRRCGSRLHGVHESRSTEPRPACRSPEPCEGAAAAAAAAALLVSFVSSFRVPSNENNRRRRPNVVHPETLIRAALCRSAGSPSRPRRSSVVVIVLVVADCRCRHDYPPRQLTLKKAAGAVIVFSLRREER